MSFKLPKVLIEVICSESCIQYQKRYCTIFNFGQVCGKQKYLEKCRSKNNASRKPYGRKRY